MISHVALFGILIFWVAAFALLGASYMASAGRQWNPYREWADLVAGTIFVGFSIATAFNIPGWNG